MSEPVVMVAPAPYVLLTLGATITGLTVKAMERKRERGEWLIGRELIKAPDGRIYLSLKGYASWVESGTA